MPRHQVCSCLSWLFSLSLLLGLTESLSAQSTGTDLHATTSLPSVTLLRAGDGRDSEGDRTKWPWEFVFEDPAYFAWVGFDKHGCTVEQDSLTIYEGMTIRMERDGRYEMRCRIEAPKTPITVRMQLTVIGFPTASGLPGTITIPPFRVVPYEASDSGDLNETSDSYEVVYVGRSELLRRLYINHLAKFEGEAKEDKAPVQKPTTDNWNVSRTEALAFKAQTEESYRHAYLKFEKNRSDANKADYEEANRKRLAAQQRIDDLEAQAPLDHLLTLKSQAEEHYRQAYLTLAKNGSPANQDAYEEANRKRLAAQQRIDAQVAKGGQGLVGDSYSSVAQPVDVELPVQNLPRSLREVAYIQLTRSGTSRFGSVPKK